MVQRRGEAVGGVFAGARTWRDRVAASPHLLAVRLLVDASPGVAMALFAWTVVSALSPVLLLVATGHLVGTVPDALGGDATDASQRRLTLAVLAVGAAYIVTVVLGPIHDGLRIVCRARITFGLQDRLIAAVNRPVGIAHLENTTTQNRVAGAQGTLTNYFPADAPAALAAVVASRASGLVACLVIGMYWWWLGLALFLLWHAIRRPLRSILLGYIRAFGGEANVMRRADYFLSLPTAAGPAKEVRVFGLARWLIEQFTNHWHEGMEASWRTLTRYRRTVTVLAVVVGSVYAFATWVVADAASVREIGVGAFATLLPMLVIAANAGMMSMDEVQLEWMLAALPNMRDLEHELAAEPMTAIGTRSADGRPSEAVVFDSVGFQYPSAERPVFECLDLTLAAGASTAIVGANGAGKTTLVKLLCRLYDPTSGVILVDGEPLTSFGAVSWRQTTAVVFQDFNHYPVSVADNVAFGAPEHADDRDGLARVAERVGLDEVVAGLPYGWSTIVSSRYEGGVDLSGGQWQRVALARSLFAVEHGAKVLILDEPTASLDVRAEAEFYDRFLEITAGVTTLVISHRFATVRRADTIYVIEQGRVIECGSHDELLGARGTYCEYFTMQASRFGDDGMASPRLRRRRTPPVASSQEGARRGRIE